MLQGSAPASCNAPPPHSCSAASRRVHAVRRRPAAEPAARGRRCKTEGSDRRAPGWPRVKALLDRLPVFTVANEQGQPLQYEADGKPLALLYADVDAAKSELKSAKEEHPSLGLDIVPMGLGEAFQLHRNGRRGPDPVAG